MIDKKILITGASGFIGRNVAHLLLSEGCNLTAIVRPKTNKKKLNYFPAQLQIVEIDLADIISLKKYLEESSFDIILHIGALRGGRRFSNKTYYDANVAATEQLALNALKTNAKLIFCSSVGVYGAIPKELPANINTEFQDDNYYHYTKIKAEQIIQKLAMNGLKASIVRPAIVYGEDDYGFPYTLTKLIHRKLFFLPDTDIRIHLANINVVKEVFYKLVQSHSQDNKVYNVADIESVKLKDLVDFISESLTGKKYPDKRSISGNYFKKAEKLAKKYNYDNFLNRIKLISYSWFYDVRDTYEELSIKRIKTIPNFQSFVEWYKRHKGL